MMKLVKIFFSVFVVFSMPIQHYVGSVIFEDCGSIEGQFISINVSSCDVKSPFCTLKKGTNMTLSISLRTREEIGAIKVVVHGILGSLPIPFIIPQPDGCLDSGLVCPVPSNYDAVYTTTIPVMQTYPKVSVTVKWELINGDDKKDIICVLIPAKIV